LNSDFFFGGAGAGGSANGSAKVSAIAIGLLSPDPSRARSDLSLTESIESKTEGPRIYSLTRYISMPVQITKSRGTLASFLESAPHHQGQRRLDRSPELHLIYCRSYRDSVCAVRSYWFSSSFEHQERKTFTKFSSQYGEWYNDAG
jgi:hypothetical protein